MTLLYRMHLDHSYCVRYSHLCFFLVELDLA